MPQHTISDAFILTGDEPTHAKTLKRLLLFFNHVLISDIKDAAIVNDDEVTESFPGMKVTWNARGHYPRVSDFEERYYRCLQGAETVISRRLVQQVESRNIKTIDPGVNWLCYNSSLSDLDLLKSAAIDASEKKPGLAVPNTIFAGMAISQPGIKSKYSIEYKEPVNLQNIHNDWNPICHLRIGRAIKSIRLAQALNAAPIATDVINSSIAFALANKALPFHYSENSAIDFAISTEIIDNEKLESLLSEASWGEVLRLRREILPHVAKTKVFLSEKTKQISSTPYIDIEDYLKSLKELKDQLADLQEQEADAWEALRIGSIFKAGGTTASAYLGTLAMPSLTAFPNLIFELIAAGLIITAALTPELQKLIPAHRKTREHPLFFLEKLKVDI